MLIKTTSAARTTGSAIGGPGKSVASLMIIRLLKRGEIPRSNGDIFFCDPMPVLVP